MGSRDIEIREAADEDLETVASIARETLEEYVEASGGDTELFSADFLRSTLEDSRMLVAENDGRVVGYLQYQIRPDKLIVNGAAIRPDWQRQGIGTRLFRRGVDAGLEGGCQQVVISVQPENRSVYELYLRLGFVEGDNPSGWNQTLSMPMKQVLGLF